MSASARLKLISDHPIGDGLDAFHASFDSICNSTGIRSADEIDELGREDAQDLASSLLSALQILPVSRQLQSSSGVGTVRNELLRLVSTVASDDFDFDRVKPLLKAALADNQEDALIWDLVSAAALESTPPRRPIPPSTQQTPLSQNTSGLVNSSELRHDVDRILKLELEYLYVGLPNFHETFFGDVPALDMVSEAVFRQCSEGETPLFRDGDISINNLMVNEDERNPSWRSFLIDLDLAVIEQREIASGAKGKTGTRAFMAIGALLGQHHSFMHDLESFFWVLFWICIHYDGPGHDIGPTEFDKWNYVGMQELAKLKKGEVSDERDFCQTAEENFTTYYQPLIPCVNRLRKVVFPNGRRWVSEDDTLYLSMKNILRDTQKDPNIAEE
ncbi:serine threonine-protein kinase sgk2 [Purpureocillium lilacinum]|uniref:Serine threonine-protein kinase sgk2 n=1 Tax=Purpureocillium lilacinum TaxID=33203 RepID=A0A179FB04_PURLI|nr:serine threonine-protein kinase sgk2 [Purpureocillium lilacinum]